MNSIYITICALVILLGFEIRYRLMAEELNILKTELSRLEKEVLRLNEEVKMKQDIYKEYKPPT